MEDSLTTFLQFLFTEIEIVTIDRDRIQLQEIFLTHLLVLHVCFEC